MKSGAEVEIDVDPEVVARAELSQAMCPAPSDIAEMLSPLACLLFLEQMSWAALTCWTAWLSDLPKSTPTAPDSVMTAFVGIAEAVGMLDAAAVAVGLAPPEKVDAPWTSDRPAEG